LGPKYGSALLPESSLELLDRALCFGDVVKRNSSDAMSGTVVHTEVSCTLRPTFTGQRLEKALRIIYPGDEDSIIKRLSTHDKSELHNVPAKDLRCEEEYLEGDLIVYNNWIGEIESTYDEVTIRLPNDTVVTVEEPAELFVDDVPWPNQAAATQPFPVDRCYVGQLVSTKKGNLRRGRWKFGAYDPSVAPRGYVVAVRIIQVEVHWISQNVLALGSNETAPQPPMELELDVLESGDVCFYKKGGLPACLSDGQPYIGPNTGSGAAVGEFVRFKDIDGATAKYGGLGTTQTGVPENMLYRLPRIATLGYDMNVFQIIRTITMVTVLWQDLSMTYEVSTDLLPYLNVDDHDVWPGEIVAVKENVLTEPGAPTGPTDGLTRPQKIGVVQSVNASERMAGVRWYKDSAVELAGERKSIFIPGSRLGTLSDETDDISFYEIEAYPGLTKRRGDFVLIAPEQSMRFDDFGAEITNIPTSIDRSALNNNRLLSIDDQATGTSTANRRVEMGLFRSWLSRLTAYNPQVQTAISGQSHESILWDHNGLTASQPHGQVDGHQTNGEIGSPSSPSPVDWVGEIVDLGLDGLLTVRLGALEEIRDVRVPLERVLVIIGDDDETDGEDGDDEDEIWDDDVSDDTRSSYDLGRTIEETFEYEGGERLDGDGGDEMWTTDDQGMDTSSEGDNPSAPKSTASKESMPEEIAATPKSNAQDQSKATQTQNEVHGLSVAEQTISANPSGGSSLSEGPASFAVLDTEPPRDHHFLNKQTDLIASRMRRIQKEHKILNSSLPDGIFVRTWEARLDLLRVLIIGPAKTPYELAPFIMDFRFGPSFPLSPPDAYFHSWTNGVGRINPNLYEDGKICLSLLGTWPADAKNEGWSSNRSSMLQILVSLMGLVLVKEPYYNEAGFDALVGTEESRITSSQYSERALVMAKGFVRHALVRPVGGFEDAVDWLYLPGRGERPQLLQRILESSREIVRRSEAKADKNGETLAGPGLASSEEVTRVSSGALVLLRKHVVALEECMARSQQAGVV